MFHMGADLVVARGRRCLLVRRGAGRGGSPGHALDLPAGRPASPGLGDARRRQLLRPRARRRPGRAGRARGRAFNEMAGKLEAASSTRAASSWPGRATTCGRRWRRSRRCSRRSRTAVVDPPTITSAAMREQVRILARLVDDLFELARIDAGALTLELRNAELAGLIESCVRGLEAEAHARHIRMEARVQNGSWARCEPEKVERVLYNLLTNALHHTPSDGSVAVLVSPRPGRGGSDRRGHRQRHLARGRVEDVRPLLAGRSRADERLRPARASGLPSRGVSSRRTAAASGPSLGPRAGPASPSRSRLSPSRESSRRWARRRAHSLVPGRSRRAPAHPGRRTCRSRGTPSQSIPPTRRPTPAHASTPGRP